MNVQQTKRASEMQEGERELYLLALTLAAVAKRPLSEVQQRMVDRKRLRYPLECEQLDRQIETDLAEAGIANRMASVALLSA